MVASWEKKPWRSALRAEMDLPSGVTGPLDLAPLAREAAIWAGVRGAFWVGLEVWVKFSIAR